MSWVCKTCGVEFELPIGGVKTLLDSVGKNGRAGVGECLCTCPNQCAVFVVGIEEDIFCQDKHRGWNVFTRLLNDDDNGADLKVIEMKVI